MILTAAPQVGDTLGPRREQRRDGRRAHHARRLAMQGGGAIQLPPSAAVPCLFRS
jgi:hypothetical protein